MIRMARPALKIAPAARSPERIALAASGAHYAAALKRLAATVAAQEKTEAAISAARDALAAATEALEKAKVDSAASIAGTLRSRQKKSVAAARAELTEAEDTLESTIAAETGLQRQHKAAEQSLMFAKMTLNSRISDAVRVDPATAKLLMDFESSRREMVRLRRAIEVLDGKSALPDEARLWAADRDWKELSNYADQ